MTFVDTNVLAYAYDPSETAEQAVARALLETLWRERAGVLSTQVLQELYLVTTRKFDPPLPSVPPARSSCSTPPGRWCRSTFPSSSPPRS